MKRVIIDIMANYGLANRDSTLTFTYTNRLLLSYSMIVVIIGSQMSINGRGISTQTNPMKIPIIVNENA